MTVNIPMDINMKPWVKTVLFLLLAAILIQSRDKEPSVGARLGIWRGKVTTVTASGAMITTSLGTQWVSSNTLSAVLLRGDSLLVLGTGRGRFITPYSIRVKKSASPIRDIREKFMSLLYDRIEDDEARGLAAGLLMGLRGMITQDTSEVFRNSGTSHLLALSGLHTAIAAGIMLLVSRLFFGKKPVSYILAAAGVVFFVLLSGARASTVRAGIMSTCVILWMCWRGGRADLLSFWWLALILSSALMPETLTDKGAWMSYGAVLSLIFFGRSFRGKASFVLSPLFAGITVTAAMAPLIIHIYGGFAWLGPTATVLSLPMLIAVMCLGVLSAAGIPGAQTILAGVTSLWHEMLRYLSHSPLSIDWKVLWPLWAGALLLLRVFSCWNGFHRRFR